MKSYAYPRPRFAAAVSLAVALALMGGCLRSETQSRPQGGSTAPAAARGKLPGEIAPGYLAADRVAIMAHPSVAQPPPPLVAADPAQLTPEQPESVVPTVEAQR